MPENHGPGQHRDYVRKNILQQKGDLFVASVGGTVTRLPIGVNGQVLTADTAELAGLKWFTPSGGGGGGSVTFDNPIASNPGDTMSQGVDVDAARADHRHAREFHGVTQHGSSVVDHGSIAGLGDDDHFQYTRKDTLTTKGDLYVATGAGILTRLPVGTNGQTLKSDSAQASGLAWGADNNTTDHSGLTNLGLDAHTQYLNVARGDIRYPLKSLVTAKGDLLVSTANAVLAKRAVGTNGQVLTADSAELDGVKWATPSVGSGGVTFADPGVSSPGDVIAGGASTSAARADHRHGRSGDAAKYLTRSTWWTTAGGQSGTLLLVLNTLYAVPFYLSNQIVIDRLAVGITTAGTAGAVVRTGIYDDNADGFPGSLRINTDGTHVATAVAVPERILAAAQTLTPGLYWLVAAAQVAASTVRGVFHSIIGAMSSAALALGATTFKSYSVTGISGALPASFGTVGLASNTAGPAIAFRRQ